jgi:pimeloyl-ACP methyl ester carboxylesterase
MRNSPSSPDGSARTALRSADGFVSGTLIRPAQVARAELLVCIHGGGCNSNYFDLNGCSMVLEAAARGYAVLLVDRPGHAGNPPLSAAHPIAASAPAIRRFIDGCRPLVPEAKGIALVGHSIGGAIALHLASRCGDWPLRGIAVSGIGEEPAPAIKAIELPPGAERVDPPAELTDSLFYAGGEPLSWKAIASLRKAAELWLVAEVTDVMETWPREWPEVARGIRDPVHLRLAEHERVWCSGEEAVATMAGRLSGTAVDAALLRGGGHLYEVSRRGPDLLRAQLDFLEACGAPAGRD